MSAPTPVHQLLGQLDAAPLELPSQPEHGNLKAGRSRFGLDLAPVDRKLLGKTYEVLDMTRIESGEKRRQLNTVDLCAAVERAVELIKVEAGERGISIREWRTFQRQHKKAA